MKEQEVVRLSMIDQKRKVRIEAQLVEKGGNPELEKELDDAKIKLANAIMDGQNASDLMARVKEAQDQLDKWSKDHTTIDSIDVTEIAGKVSDYVADKLQSDDINVVRDQIYPFVSQIMSKSMVKIVGLDTAHFMLVSDLIRSSMIYNMTVAFLVYKFLQNNNYKITTSEEPISDQEIADYKRMSKENELAALAAIMGVSVEEFQEAVAQGKGISNSSGDKGPETTH